MGKGDKRTKRGKLFSGTYGKSRPSKRNKKRMQKNKTKQNEGQE
ncbi:MAG: 30S ribosomal protein THX [Bacteroidales bacterium]|jgi:30S ribosomal protein S31|nr:30S ribosomal protein THX [Bacteroidales bacterium]MDI9576188.1 30S ribosomal protein THX [Bacteroidota bacterium]MDD2593192.1 30S ribosomal protein THX [Bacteroidales bacterium]MDD3756236.1 30S ribosomal protein THX [Bacteroidales bacterium]MDY0401345.1 30S ribosomal protein THX [Bacteroidales bacterium]